MDRLRVPSALLGVALRWTTDVKEAAPWKFGGEP